MRWLLARAEGNANLAKNYWPLLTKWADYLRAKGLDPENQLSTDDFAGHLAHNSNLSIKAIEAVASYSELAKLIGDSARATDYRNSAKQMAEQWERMAADGDHYKLAFDKTGTWSQKYNLVWDKVLGLNLFAPAIARKEMAFYLAHQNEFGLPLDNRKTYTKLDWIVWTATLAEDPNDFQRADCAAVQICGPDADARAAFGLVRHSGCEAAGISGAVGGRRGVYQNAG